MARTPAKTKAATASRARAKPSGKPASLQERTPLLEWIVAAAGLVLTLAAVAVIGWEAIQGGDAAPKFAVRATAVEASPTGYVVRFEARNTGDAPTAQVTVRGELQSPATAPETAEATLDYLPARSVREGGLVFDHDPSAGELTLRVRGYVDP